MVSAHLEFAIDGARVEPAHAVRAVSLAIDRYCSVAASLASDIVIGRGVIVNGVRVIPGAEAQSE